MKRILLLASTLSAIPSLAHAETFEKACPDIPACSKAIGALLGQSYVFDNDVKGQFHATPELELTKENAELLFTNMLASEGFARVPLGRPGLFQVMRQRDARDGPLPLITASKETPPALPDTWDLITMKYNATYPSSVEDIARTARSFMPANSRIIPSEAAGTLLVTDTAMNVKKLYAIIRDLDLEVAPQLKARLELERRERQQRQKEKSAGASTPPNGR